MILTHNIINPVISTKLLLIRVHGTRPPWPWYLSIPLPFPLILVPKVSFYFILYDFDLFFCWLLQLTFSQSLITRMTVYWLFWLSFLFLSSVYFLYVILQISCYKHSICVYWTIYISPFTDLVWTIFNTCFSVNNLVKLAVSIILHLRLTFVVNSRNAMLWDWLNDYCSWFVELGSIVLSITSDQNSTQQFLLCHGAWLNDFNNFLVSFLCVLLHNVDRKK